MGSYERLSEVMPVKYIEQFLACGKCSLNGLGSWANREFLATPVLLSCLALHLSHVISGWPPSLSFLICEMGIRTLPSWCTISLISKFVEGQPCGVPQLSPSQQTSQDPEVAELRGPQGLVHAAVGRLSCGEDTDPPGHTARVGVQRGSTAALWSDRVSIPHPNAPQPEELTNILEICNVVFTSMFALEMILKLAAFGLFDYLRNPYNIFDSIIVIIRYSSTLPPGSRVAGGGDRI